MVSHFYVCVARAKASGKERKEGGEGRERRLKCSGLATNATTFGPFSRLSGRSNVGDTERV